ncbi:MAG: aspartate kinase [Methanosarcinaceae archaeon]|nr:aspartate kinase [Methanosarcinaceae archaeon]
MKIVMKFGGTSIGNGEKIKHVSSLLKSYFDFGHKVVVVTSALEGVTDSLLETSNACLAGKFSAIPEFIEKIRKKHIDAANISIKDPEILGEVIGHLNGGLDELEKIMLGICYLGELTPRSKDNISSFGERLAAPVISGALRSAGVPSTFYTGGDAGIVTTSVYGNARPLLKSYENINRILSPGLENSVQIVTGFIGVNESGNITTLGRSGSDYSASIIGVGIKADEIWLWKEVDGIMTANPKIVKSAKTLKFISYKEAMELASLGAEVLHPRTIEPAMQYNIPVRVKSTFKPDFDGTLVVAEDNKFKNVVKSISTISKISLVNVSSVEMVGTSGHIGKLFTALAENNISVRLVSQGSESSISFIINDVDKIKALNAIESEFGGNINIEYRNNINVVAVVGAGMAGTPGVARRVFTALGKQNINIIMISQGSSEYNISCVVDSSDTAKAVGALHSEFELDKIE